MEVAAGEYEASGPVPGELQSKMESCPQFRPDATVQTWKRFPCSLHFPGVPRPSPAAVVALERLSAVLGPFGQQQGEYGAGGGGVHIMYLGVPPSGAEFFPPLEELVQMMRLADSIGPHAGTTRWMSTLDPLHQHLFTHDSGEYAAAAAAAGGEDAAVLPLLQRLYALTSSLCTRPYSTEVMHERIVGDFPFMTETRLLFVLPRFARIHGEKCRGGRCPCDDSVIAESTAAGDARDAGVIFECPCHAVFQLQGTGEVPSLVNFDNRD